MLFAACIQHRTTAGTGGGSHILADAHLVPADTTEDGLCVKFVGFPAFHGVALAGFMALVARVKTTATSEQNSNDVYWRMVVLAARLVIYQKSVNGLLMHGLVGWVELHDFKIKTHRSETRQIIYPEASRSSCACDDFSLFSESISLFGNFNGG